jgi:hypothetical protein
MAGPLLLWFCWAFKAWTAVDEAFMMIDGTGLEGGVDGLFEGLGAIICKRRSAL